MKKVKLNTSKAILLIKRVNRLALEDRGDRKKFLLLLIVVCIATQLWTVDSWVFSQLTNRLSNQKSVFAGMSILVPILVLFVVDLIPTFFRYRRDRTQQFLQNKISEKSQELYWSSYSKLDLQDRENPEIQDAINNASRNQNVIQQILRIELDLLVGVLSVTLAAFMLATIAWWYAIVVIAMVAPRVYFNRKRKIRNYKQEKQMNEIGRYRSTIESFIGTKESLINCARSYYLKLYNSLRYRQNLLGYKSNAFFSKVAFWGDVWFFTLLAGLILSVASKVESGSVQIGAMFIMFASINRMYAELDKAITQSVDLEVSLKRAKDFFFIVDLEPIITDAPNAITLDVTRPPRIEFEDVHFSYPGSSREILKGVTFVIEPGEKIGLVAKNGEGKTTIAMLLLRFYDPTKGSIRINGTDLRLIKRESLLKMTGALFQDFNTLKTSIRSSLRSSNPEAQLSDEKLWRMLEDVTLKEYVEKLPQQLDQKVDKVFKDSVKLSGGQNQKLGLASITSKDLQVVLLDEFTSSLDPEAEKEIVGNYKRIIAGKSALIISHRYISLGIVDRILVLEEGLIAESGKFSDLMAIDGGIFKKLYNASRFSLEPSLS